MRLEAGLYLVGFEYLPGFYSKLVRLEVYTDLDAAALGVTGFLFQTGAIRSGRSADDLYTYLVLFLFQTGAIRSYMLLDTSVRSLFLFQTGAIRSHIIYAFVAGFVAFLFQTGAIRRSS